MIVTAMPDRATSVPLESADAPGRTSRLGVRQTRLEDDRFLRGCATYVSDVALPGMLHLAVLRSPHAHAAILSVDGSAAMARPGVQAILTGADCDGAGVGHLASLITHKQADGQPMAQTPYPILAADRVRFVGDAVAFVVADTREAAEDALESIVVDYESLPSVTDSREAVSAGAPELWPLLAPGNKSFVYPLGDASRVAAAFEAADHIATLDLRISRVSANPLEGRVAIGAFDPQTDAYTLYAGVQTPHSVRNALAAQVLKIAPETLRVIAPDIGGAFGMKGGAYPEYAMVLWAARHTGRPVRWAASRGESFQSDYHGRDNHSTVQLALDKAGTFLGLRVETLANLGAYLGNRTVHSPVANLGGLSGVYRTPAIHAAVTGVMTNTQPTAPYRGAGRPEAIYVLERVIDAAARQTGIERIALRRRNMIDAAQLPYDTGFVYTYDSGNFVANMEKALEVSAWATFEQRRIESKRLGMLRGIGLANAIEIAGGPVATPIGDFARLRFDGDGKAHLDVGTHSHGQGHETTFTQIAAEWLGLSLSDIHVHFGDTQDIPQGVGTFGSRSTQVVAASLRRALDDLVAQATPDAARLLQTGMADITFDRGIFAVAGTGRALALPELARALAKEGRLLAAAAREPAPPTFPCGCHICEIEVDPDTGATTIIQYIVVEDVGTVINPLIVEGQIHGGVAQGLGQALGEFIHYEAGSGQLLTASFMDYAMPRATDVPPLATFSNPSPTPLNTLGVKGVGEAGVVGSLSAVSNALADALHPLGIDHVEMPATPFRLWRLIQSAREAQTET